jgi:hypothetical protein
MNRAELLQQLEEGRERFLDAIEGLSEAALQQPGVAGDWSVKDILAHLARWEAELVKLLWQAQHGEKPNTVHFTQRDVDETNARWHRQSQSRPLDRVLDDFHGVRVQTTRRIESLPAGALENPAAYPWLAGKPLWEWIAGDSFEHEAEHEVQIRNWRQESGGNMR